MSLANRAPQDFSLTTKGPMVSCFLGLWSEEAHNDIKKIGIFKTKNLEMKGKEFLPKEN